MRWRRVSKKRQQIVFSFGSSIRYVREKDENGYFPCFASFNRLKKDLKASSTSLRICWACWNSAADSFRKSLRWRSFSHMGDTGYVQSNAAVSGRWPGWSGFLLCGIILIEWEIHLWTDALAAGIRSNTKRVPPFLMGVEHMFCVNYSTWFHKREEKEL